MVAKEPFFSLRKQTDRNQSAQGGGNQHPGPRPPRPLGFVLPSLERGLVPGTGWRGKCLHQGPDMVEGLGPRQEASCTWRMLCFICPEPHLAGVC